MMKKIILLGVLSAMSLSMSPGIHSKTVERNDSIATAIRLNSLQNKRESLQREIKAQDTKRDKQIAGVSAATLEEMNDRQDSICLALRSELVDVILEIKELSPTVDSPQLINHLNNLVNRKENVDNSSNH